MRRAPEPLKSVRASGRPGLACSPKLIDERSRCNRTRRISQTQERLPRWWRARKHLRQPRGGHVTAQLTKDVLQAPSGSCQVCRRRGPLGSLPARPLHHRSRPRQSSSSWGTFISSTASWTVLCSMQEGITPSTEHHTSQLYACKKPKLKNLKHYI